VSRLTAPRRAVFDPPTPKASAWQALTCLAVAKAKEERPTSNKEVGRQRKWEVENLSGDRLALLRLPLHKHVEIILHGFEDEPYKKSIIKIARERNPVRDEIDGTNEVNYGGDDGD
jgi:hypothetical protein